MDDIESSEGEGVGLGAHKVGLNRVQTLEIRVSSRQRGLAESRMWTRRVANLNVLPNPSLLGESGLQLVESKAKNVTYLDRSYVPGTRCYKT